MASILVVDDEQAIRFTLRYFLQESGHTVEVAEDAEGALRLLLQHKVDLVISDVVLPGLTGLEFVKLLGRISPETQVVLVSGDAGAVVDALRCGAVDCLTKPVGKASVMQAVERAISRKAQRGRESSAVSVSGV